jgi:uncharacterized lipoprotein YddW (UPF0748 family)
VVPADRGGPVAATPNGCRDRWYLDWYAVIWAVLALTPTWGETLPCDLAAVGGKRVILRTVRGLVSRRPLSATTLLVLLAVTLAVGSVVGVLFAVERGSADRAGADAAYGPVDTTGCPVDAARPKRQFRAMWITTVLNLDWPSRSGLDEATIKAEYVSWLDLAVKDRFNAVIVMVRVAGDTIWPSRYEPWSQYLTGTRGGDPGWDPLAFVVAETHRRGLEFHAWFNPYRASMPAPEGAGTDVGQLAAGHPLRKHPEWAVAYPATGSSARLYFNPGEPDARRFVEDAMLDAVARYDIDGVHFDDFFYPYPVGSQDFPDDATFARYGAGFADKAAWRRENVDLMVKEMHQRIHDLKPWVRFGVSPFGIWRNASADPLGSPTAGNQSYASNAADTKKWVEKGWIDYIVPQLYWNIGFTIADYAALVPWWSKVVKGTGVQLYIGQAAYRAGSSGAWLDAGELSAHLALNQRYPQVAGDVYFSAKDVRADRLGAVSRVVAERYAAPALTPEASGAPPSSSAPSSSAPSSSAPSSSAPPASGSAQSTAGTAAASGFRSAPTITDAAADQGGGAVRITWKAPDNKRSGSDAVRAYLVYRFDGPGPADRCGFADATHLVATTGAREVTDATAHPGQQYSYYVTAVDRLGRESDPSSGRVLGAGASLTPR